MVGGLRRVFCVLVVLVVWLPVSARADITDAQATNVQEGDNASDSRQRGEASSGDAVGGQVVGIVSEGHASVDANNVTVDADVQSGDAAAENRAAQFVGHAATSATVVSADISNTTAVNLQEGDNDWEATQLAEASSGDAVAGQVAGIVTGPGGNAQAVLDNRSENVAVRTGDAVFRNRLAGFVGLHVGEGLLVGQPIAGLPLFDVPAQPDQEVGISPDSVEVILPPLCEAEALGSEGFYEISISCQDPIETFVIRPPSGKTFEPALVSTPTGYDCTVIPEEISCEAEGEGSTEVSLLVAGDMVTPFEPGDVLDITVNGNIDLSVTLPGEDEDEE